MTTMYTQHIIGIKNGKKCKHKDSIQFSILLLRYQLVFVSDKTNCLQLK